MTETTPAEQCLAVEIDITEALKHRTADQTGVPEYGPTRCYECQRPKPCPVELALDAVEADRQP
jgi:hypothetical protein